VATSANGAIIPGMDLPALNPLLDAYNIMTYDFTSGSWGDNLTGHHAKTLKSEDPLASRAGFSAEEAAEFYV
jgi:GH18 family chitinase